MKKLILSLIILFAGLNFAQAQVSAEYTKELRNMLKASGQDQTFDVVIDQMLDIYKQQYTQLSAKQWDVLGDLFHKEGIDKLIEMLAPIYAKHLTIDDLKAIAAFYDTPAGSKLSSSTPAILAESMQIGAKWGESLGEEFAKKIKEMEE